MGQARFGKMQADAYTGPRNGASGKIMLDPPRRSFQDNQIGVINSKSAYSDMLLPTLGQQSAAM